MLGKRNILHVYVPDDEPPLVSKRHISMELASESLSEPIGGDLFFTDEHSVTLLHSTPSPFFI